MWRWKARSTRQPIAREGQVGPAGWRRGPQYQGKPGNAGGGKGPQVAAFCLFPSEFSRSGSDLRRPRVFKTEFILDYLSQPALRTRIRRGLLKGEQLHALARCVHYGRLGRLDQRDFERQTGAASCLLLILAAIIYGRFGRSIVF